MSFLKTLFKRLYPGRPSEPSAPVPPAPKDAASALSPMAKARLEEARRALQRGEHEAALALGLELEASGVRTLGLFRLMAFCYTRRGEPLPAKAYFLRALPLDPDPGRGLGSVFQACKAAGDQDGLATYGGRLAESCRNGGQLATASSWRLWIKAEVLLGAEGRPFAALEQALRIASNAPFVTRWCAYLLRETNLDPASEQLALDLLASQHDIAGDDVSLLAAELLRANVRADRYEAACELLFAWGDRIAEERLATLRAVYRRSARAGTPEAARLALHLLRTYGAALLRSPGDYHAWIRLEDAGAPTAGLKSVLEQALAAFPEQAVYGPSWAAHLYDCGGRELALEAGLRLFDASRSAERAAARSAERVVPLLVERALDRGDADQAVALAARCRERMASVESLCSLARLFNRPETFAEATACYLRVRALGQDGPTLETSKDYVRWIEAEHFLVKTHDGDGLAVAAKALRVFPGIDTVDADTARFVLEHLRHGVLDERIERFAAAVRAAGVGDEGFYLTFVEELLNRGRLQEAAACSLEWRRPPEPHAFVDVEVARQDATAPSEHALQPCILAAAEKDCRAFSERQPQIYASVRRHLDDAPLSNAKPYKIALFGRRRTLHFMDPVMEALKERFEVYRYFHFHEDLPAQIPGLDVLWIEWGAFAFALEKLRGVDRGKCKVFVRIIDWEASHEGLMQATPWAAADGLVFISSAVQEQFLAHRPQTGEARRHYIPCGLNERQFPLVRRARPGKRLLLVSISLEDRKGYLRALELLRRVVDADPEFTLTIKADLGRHPAYTMRVLQEVTRLGLEDHVFFLLPRREHDALFANLTAKDDLLPVYGNADVIFSTSKHEGFHYAVGEGMLTGMYPVVYPWEWGEPAQFWGEYVAADLDDFVARVLTWGRLDPEERVREGARARQYAIERFGLAATRRRFLDLFGIPPDPAPHSKRLILFAHRHLFKSKPRGGEMAMAHFLEDLRAQGYECLIVARHNSAEGCERCDFQGFTHISVPWTIFSECVAEIMDWWRPDVVLTWDQPTYDVAPLCWGKGIPYVLFIHYWSQFNPPPYRDMLRDHIDPEFHRRHAPIFRRAAAIISNAQHVADVVERFYGVKSLVAYTPVRQLEPLADAQPRYVTLVTAQKCGGGDLVAALAARMPDVSFLVLFGEDSRRYPQNVTVRPYQSAPYNEFFHDTKVLLFPFNEDPCGTGRVVYEAYFLGIPVVAVGKGGIPEVVPADCLVADNEDLDAWEATLRRVLDDYPRHAAAAVAAMEGYSLERELGVVRRAVNEAAAREPAVCIDEQDIPLDAQHFELGALRANAMHISRLPDAAQWLGIWATIEPTPEGLLVTPLREEARILFPLDLEKASAGAESSKRFFSCSLHVSPVNESLAPVNRAEFWRFELFEYDANSLLGRKPLGRLAFDLKTPLDCGGALDSRTRAAWCSVKPEPGFGPFLLRDAQCIIAAPLASR